MKAYELYDAFEAEEQNGWDRRRAIFLKAVAQERERCAAIADAMGCEAVAHAIRHPEQAG